ncbi:MAG: pyridoxal-dependent decarboxylase, exosortase A system-associated [Gammaproteobacteria bacterium]|nr:pyridoxal-dependent decarboxylase, exosortase A system-associated [Gammaproteobacteria bacterium]
MNVRKSATHARLGTLARRDGELLVNGIPLSRLAERVGQTPFYAYDRSLIAARVAAVRAALPARVSLHYAIKANPMPAVVGCLRELVDGFDVASHGEMLVALDAGMPAREVSFAGPAKQIAELRAAIAAGITINCESETELDRIARLASELGVAADVALRVNPAFELKGSGMKMAGSPRQFGIDAERIPAALQTLHAAGLGFAGLHIFCGSQNLSAEAIVEANQRTIELAVTLCDTAPRRPRFVNIGGGYGIPYFPGEQPLDLTPVGAALDAALAAAPTLADIEIVVELGRYLVGEAGYYVTRVSDIKVSQGHTFVMVDGGLHHHLANSGNFGQVLRKNYPVVVGNKLDQPTAEAVTVVGPLCTPLDLVADRMALPAIAVGDFIVVLQSGAYGPTASPQRFLGHPAAAEVLV